MKLISTCRNPVLKDLGRRTRLENVSALLVVASSQQKNARFFHDSYIPKGAGGRSSFSGIVATVFGSTGFLGHAVVNHLGAYGSGIMLPHRGTCDRIQRLKLMGDLGQIMFREKFSIKQDDDVVRELIEHSNCVINLAKVRMPYNHYTMEEVNIEWPERLARLVAEKDDGTRFIHVTHLNCHLGEARDMSNILRLDYAAENSIREIYPASIIARSSGIFGYFDNYLRLFMNDRFEQLWPTGAVPVLYDAGNSTIVRPVFLSDVAEGIARLAKHPDAPGNTFEFVGSDCFTLHDMLEFMFTGMDRKFYDFNSIGPLDRSKATKLQKMLHYPLELYFWKRFKPRLFLPRAFDLITRAGSRYSPWLTFDMYKQLHVSDQLTGAPGLSELGIESAPFEEKAFESFMQPMYCINARPEKQIPRIEVSSTQETAPAF